jgi:thioredoxin 1
MEINSIELQEKINNGEKVIVDFYAQWCGPCKIMKPIFEKVSNENNTDVKMYTMDVEENRDFAVNFGIRSVPTIKGFTSGKDVITKVGLQEENQLKELITTLNSQ